MKYISFVLFLALFCFYGTALKAQITLNKVDSLGLKQGMWKEFKIPFDFVTQYIAIKVPKIKRNYYLLTSDKDRRFFPIIECVGAYKNGMKTGIWFEYYSNGKIKSQIEYENGIPFGKCKIFWENGILKMEFLIGTETNIPIIIYEENGTFLSKQTGVKSEVIKAIYEN